MGMFGISKKEMDRAIAKHVGEYHGVPLPLDPPKPITPDPVLPGPPVVLPPDHELSKSHTVKSWLIACYALGIGQRLSLLDGYVEMVDTTPGKKTIHYYDDDIIGGYDVFDLQAEWVSLSGKYPKIYVHFYKLHGKLWFSEYYKVWGKESEHVGTAKDHSYTGLDKGEFSCGFRKPNGVVEGAKSISQLKKEWL